MANNDWEIHDVVDETEIEGEASGKVQIDKAPNIEPDDLGYSINTPDSRVQIPVEDGGTVQSSGKKRREEQHHLIRVLGTFILYLFVLLLFAYGFVLVVTNDVQSGNLDFKTYMALITAFLGWLGLANFRKRQ